MDLLKLWKHDHPTCAAGCGTTWMQNLGEVHTEFGFMTMYVCHRSRCNMVTVASRYVKED